LGFRFLQPVSVSLACWRGFTVPVGTWRVWRSILVDVQAAELTACFSSEVKTARETGGRRDVGVLVGATERQHRSRWCWRGVAQTSAVRAVDLGRWRETVGCNEEWSRISGLVSRWESTCTSLQDGKPRRASGAVRPATVWDAQRTLQRSKASRSGEFAARNDVEA